MQDVHKLEMKFAFFKDLGPSNLILDLKFSEFWKFGKKSIFWEILAP